MVDHSPNERHRQISDGWIRAGIFGVSDGLVTNTSFLLGFAGASPGHNVVRLAGVATLIAGGFSMASGEWLSMRATKELLEYEIGVERQSLKDDPENERRELSDMFKARGIDDELAERLSVDLMRDPELALQTHVREEMGVDPSATGSPWAAAGSSLATFSIGAFIPLVPWLWSATGNEVWWSVAFAAAGSAGVGGAIGMFTRRGVTKWALRQVMVTGMAALVTFGVGRLVGTH
ncbi:MAG: VIT1/CCC1 transporter family protein [Actinomycetota bacterium]|jgi:VIT1/CCC1 family predicted Fe2+/Mn2+ transporter|nr:VIT1/CCC1 transporter family protein [Actinomycetota bacterium]